MLRTARVSASSAEAGPAPGAEAQLGAALAERIAAAIRSRAPVARSFFERHAEEIAVAARAVAGRLAAGGRIYAFGRGPYATDAQHVAVEFVHPVLVGKPALPAADLSLSFESSLPVLVTARDVVIGFGPPEGDPAINRALRRARACGAYALDFCGNVNDASSDSNDRDSGAAPDSARRESHADFALGAISDDAHVHQEIVEIVGHLVYESVHVFLEHRQSGHAVDNDAGAAAFLYPFLGGDAASREGDLLEAVRASILQKVGDAENLRGRVAAEASAAIAAAVQTIAAEVALGGRLLLFGNGGSATDATDWALDCVTPHAGLAPIPALSLAAEPATITAIANDVGRDFIFLRQLIAHIRPHDVAIALSTSGGSANVIAALAEARKRGNRTIALLGYDGGEIRRRTLADHVIVVPSDYVPRIQEAQATIYHAIRQAAHWCANDAQRERYAG
jgi:D-sedoheptulose 7-phosphate isomerase